MFDCDFFALETAEMPTKWIGDRVLLNCGRSALRYIVRAYGIKELYVPSYTCQFVWDVLRDEGCKLDFYHIDKNFLPTKTFEKDAYILFNNYFGICDTQVEFLKLKYKNLIIDNTQAFYSNQKGLASFYSLRKFFGVPDGGLAWCDKKLNIELEKSNSYHLCMHLLKAYDKGYDDSRLNFIKNELEIDKMKMEAMSNLTFAMMKNINYLKCKKIRINNFNLFQKYLNDTNELKIELKNNDVPMFYPYLNCDKNISLRLKEKKIKLATCWCQIDKFLSNEELYLKDNLFLLPVDQRYTKKDIKEIIYVVKI